MTDTATVPAAPEEPWNAPIAPPVSTALWQRILQRARTPSGMVFVFQFGVMLILLVVLLVQSRQINALQEAQDGLLAQSQRIQERVQQNQIDLQSQMSALDALVKARLLSSDVGSGQATQQASYGLLLTQIDATLEDLAKVTWPNEPSKPRLGVQNPKALESDGKAEKKMRKHGADKQEAASLRAIMREKIQSAGGWGMGVWEGVHGLIVSYLGDLVRVQSIASVPGAQLSRPQLLIARNQIEQLLQFSRLALQSDKPDLALYNLAVAQDQARTILNPQTPQHAQVLEGINRAYTQLHKRLYSEAR